uniref:Neprosin_AP domain-containing protein n=1 Tax=Rhabditophanes sp. KR3021 TaxID=114890 RepID=A0AC35TR34_9BILA
MLAIIIAAKPPNEAKNGDLQIDRRMHPQGINFNMDDYDVDIYYYQKNCPMKPNMKIFKQLVAYALKTPTSTYYKHR